MSSTNQQKPSNDQMTKIAKEILTQYKQLIKPILANTNTNTNTNNTTTQKVEDTDEYKTFIKTIQSTS